MPDIGTLAKMAADLGGLSVALALIVFAGYGARAAVGLARQYAPQVIEAHQSQTAAIRQLSESIAHFEQQTTRAITETARTTRDMMEDQRETLIVMRSISTELRDLGTDLHASDVEIRKENQAIREEIRAIRKSIGGAA